MFSIEWRNGIVDNNAGVLARAVWLAVLVVVATESLSATELIADLNVAGKPSEFDGFEDDAVVFDDRYYIFGADDPILGEEPWVLDTNTGVVEPLGDLAPGSTNSSPREFVAIDSGVVFVATTPDLGTELWFTDGTPAGTELLLDINPGPGSSFPTGLYTATGARVLFRADDGINGVELWRSNGTPAGTVLIDDINPGAASSSPSDFALYDGLVYFRATDATNGSELWTWHASMGMGRARWRSRSLGKPISPRRS